MLPDKTDKSLSHRELNNNCINTKFSQIHTSRQILTK